MHAAWLGGSRLSACLRFLTTAPAPRAPACRPAQQDEQPYIIEANPRASRTVPFVAKAVGHPIAKYASLLMSGQTLQDLGFTEVRRRLTMTIAVCVASRRFARSCSAARGPDAGASVA